MGPASREDFALGIYAIERRIGICCVCVCVYTYIHI